jgi:hypothetical protein
MLRHFHRIPKQHRNIRQCHLGFRLSPPPTARSVSLARLPPNRRLNMDDHISSAPSATAPAPVSRYNPLTATVYTAEGRAEASDIFLNCCRLAANHSTRFQSVESALAIQYLWTLTSLLGNHVALSKPIYCNRYRKMQHLRRFYEKKNAKIAKVHRTPASSRTD